MKIKLDEFSFDYGSAIAIAIAKEGGRQLTLENQSKHVVKKWALDKIVFKGRTDERCDFLIELQNEHSIFYWIELKGGDVVKACRQILNTILLVDIPRKVKKQEARIITTGTNRIDLRTIEYLSLDKKMRSTGGKLIVRTNSFVEIV